MQILPVDLTAIVAVIMGVSVILIPVMGITARFALKPFVESLGHFFQGRNVEEGVKILERRMSLLEQQIESMDGTLRRLAEVSEFNDELHATRSADRLTEGARPGPTSAGSR
ncbi:MAG: hypothetical protein KY453_02765 [Gemmatimonadetes bacterium]|nr:hypothetical protein [Gemmatimonadota bacterium]